MAKADRATFIKAVLSMSKIAYIATDLNILKTQNMIIGPYDAIDYYLVDNENKSVDLSLHEQDFMVGELCIPATKASRTIMQNHRFSEIEVQFQFWKKQIYQDYKNDNSVEDLSSAININVNVQSIDKVNYIKINRLNQKYIFEIQNDQQMEYDLVLFENNQYVMSRLIEKQQNLFYSFTEQQKCLLTFEYKIKNFYTIEKPVQEFVFVNNYKNQSIEDNWFIYQIGKDQLFITAYIPLQMSKNVDYIKFMNSRIAQMTQVQFKNFEILDSVGNARSIGNGFYVHQAKLRNKKTAELMPSFKFWSDDEIKKYLHKVLHSKASSMRRQEADTKPELNDSTGVLQ